MLGLGPWELAIVLVLVLLVFGGKRLPELARGLGKSVTNFKAGLNEERTEETKTATQTQQENGIPPKEKNG